MRHLAYFLSAFLLFSPAFQEQHLLQAVQSGIVQKIKEALNWLKQLNNSKDIGKGSKSVTKGSKKMGVTDSHGQIYEEPTGHVTVISKRVTQLLHQQSTSNQNVLHICCSNPTFVEEPSGIPNAVQSQSKGASAWMVSYFNLITFSNTKQVHCYRLQPCQICRFTIMMIAFNSQLRWLKTFPSNKILMVMITTIYHLMLQSWYEKTAQSLVNRLLSFLWHNRLP